MITRRFVPAALALVLLCAFRSASAECDPAGQRMLEPLIGEWEEDRISESGRTLLGTLTTKLVSEGCAIVFSLTGQIFFIQFIGIRGVDRQLDRNLCFEQRPRRIVSVAQ